MKKLIYLFLCVVLAASVLSVPADAAGEVSLTIAADKTELHPGDTVTFTFAVSNPAQSPIAGLQYTVNLPEGLQYESHSLLCTSYFSMGNYNAAAANLFVTGTAELEGMSVSSWQVMTITCTVAADVALGGKTVSLSEISLYGGVDLENIPYTAGAAAFNVTHADDQHVWDEEHSEVTKAPTCTEAGVRTYTCAIEGCGKTKTENIAAAGHKPSENAEMTEPTCTEPGRRSYKCTVCGEEVRGEEITALGHQWNAGEVAKEPTCTEAGEKTYTCQNDSTHTYTEPIAALGHSKPEDESLIETVKEATCTAAGEIKYTCERCGEAVTEEVAALGHVWDEGSVTKQPAEGVEGEKTYTCTRCGETKTEPLPALTPSATATPAPTDEPEATAGPEPTAAPTTKPASQPAGTGDSAPATGDETPLALYAGLLALCLGALALCLTRRKTSRK